MSSIGDISCEVAAYVDSIVLSQRLTRVDTEIPNIGSRKRTMCVELVIRKLETTVPANDSAKAKRLLLCNSSTTPINTVVTNADVLDGICVWFYWCNRDRPVHVSELL